MKGAYRTKDGKASLDGITIVITSSKYSTGRRLTVAELFRSDNYALYDAGGVAKRFKIVFELNSNFNTADFGIVRNSLRNKLERGRVLTLLHPNYGRLRMMCGAVSVSDAPETDTFEVDFVIVPPKKSLLGLDYVEDFLNKVNEFFDKGSDYMNVIANEISYAERIVGEVLEPLNTMNKNYNDLAYIVQKPAVIYNSAASTINNFDPNYYSRMLEMVRIYKEDDCIPDGKNTVVYKKLAGSGVVDNDVKALTKTVTCCGLAEAFLNAKVKTSKDMKQANLFLILTAKEVAPYLPTDLLSSFKGVTNAFSSVVYLDLFGLSNQKIIPVKEGVLITGYFNSEEVPTLEGYYALSDYNDIEDELKLEDEVVVV